ADCVGEVDREVIAAEVERIVGFGALRRTAASRLEAILLCNHRESLDRLPPSCCNLQNVVLEVTGPMTLLSYLAIYLIWGSTFLAIRLAVASIPPLLMMGARCTIGGALLLSVAALRREWPAARDWGPGLAAGALMFG